MLIADPYVKDEAVLFEVASQQGATFKGAISREALTDHFRAEDTPDGWLAAYRAHKDEIDEKATERAALAPGETVMLQTAFF